MRPRVARWKSSSAATPSPRPPAPWQPVQLVAKIDDPNPIRAASEPFGLPTADSVATSAVSPRRTKRESGTAETLLRLMSELATSTRERTRAFTELVSYYLFRDRFGRPGKGKVEGLVKYARSNFMTPAPEAAWMEADCAFGLFASRL